MKIKFLALATLAALSVGSAQAAVESTTFDWSVHPSPQVSVTFSVSAGDTYDNFYNFSLNNTYDLSATAVANNGTKKNGGASILSNNKIELEHEISPGIYTAVDSTLFNNTSNTYDFGNLTAGNYRYELTGNSTGNLLGNGTLQSSIDPVISAVPEPETYAMLLAGLGLMGFMSRRRKSA